MNERSFTRHVEEAYRQMWRQWLTNVVDAPDVAPTTGKCPSERSIHVGQPRSRAIAPSREEQCTLVALFNEGRLDDCEKAAGRFCEAYPASGFCWKVLGIVLAQMGRNEEALKALNKSLNIEPTQADALNSRGNALRELGRLEEAVDSFEQALRIDPNYAEVYNNLGLAFRLLKRTDEAAHAYAKALKLRPDYAEAHMNMGVVLQDQGKPEAALEAYQKCLAIRPDYPEAHNNLGNVLMELRREQDALSSYQRAIDFKPDYAEAQMNYGVALQILGRTEEALALLRKALENDSRLALVCPPSGKKPSGVKWIDYVAWTMNYCEVSDDARNDIFAKAQFELQRIKLERFLENPIPDGSIIALLHETYEILNRYGLGHYEASNTQIFRGNISLARCGRHGAIFKKFSIIPEYCFGCFKILVEPERFIDHVKAFIVFNYLKIPGNNTRKCIVEVRPEISGRFKELIYCESKDEAEVLMPIVQGEIRKQIAEPVSISVKRGCSEFAQKYPAYNMFDNNGNTAMSYPEQWRKYEKEFDKTWHHVNDDHSSTFSHNHSGLTLFDALVMRRWLTYAKKIGDKSCTGIP